MNWISAALDKEKNLLFSFALSIFLSRNRAMFALGSVLIQKKSLLKTFGEINISA